jgi:hypothetical protein
MPPLATHIQDGSFVGPTSSRDKNHDEPKLYCINEHFLAGCRFDAAYPNPCTVDESGGAHHHRHQAELGGHERRPDERRQEQQARRKATNAKLSEQTRPPSAGSDSLAADRTRNFSEQQQMKLRSIAARGGLMDFLLENTLVAQGAARAIEPFLAAAPGGGARPTGEPEQIVVYLLVAMVLITILVTVAMIVVVLNWARPRPPAGQQHQPGLRAKSMDELRGGGTGGQLLTERLAYPPAISHYLSNQYQHQQHQQQQQQRAAGYFYGPPGGRLSGHAGPPPPLTAPPLTSPPPPPVPAAEPMRQYGRTHAESGRKDASPDLMDSSVF